MSGDSSGRPGRRRFAGLAWLAALAACGGAPPLDSLDRDRGRASQAGVTAFERGDLRAAETLLVEALQRARQSDDPGEVGSTAFNLAACRLELGRAEAAVPLLAEAGAALARHGEALTDVLLLRARVALALGQPSEATRHLEAARALAPDSAEVELVFAEAALHAGNGLLLEAAVERAARLLGEDRDDPGLPALLAMKGDLALLTGSAPAAAAAFDRAADLWRQQRAYRRMVLALQRAAVAHDRAGQREFAADRRLRAAASLLSVGLVEAAAPLLEAALAAAQELGSAELEQRVLALRQ